MAMTMNPVVSRSAARLWFHAGCFAAGVFAGAMTSLLALSVLFAAAEALFGNGWVAVLSLPIAWAALHDLGVPVPAPLPYRQRQVPEWLRGVLSVSAVALVFGFMLGVGFLTLFTYSVHVAFVLTIPLLESTGQMLIALAVFSIAKTLVLVVPVGVRSFEEITPRFAISARSARTLRAVAALSSLAVGLSVLTST